MNAEQYLTDSRRGNRFGIFSGVLLIFLFTVCLCTAAADGYSSRRVDEDELPAILLESEKWLRQRHAADRAVADDQPDDDGHFSNEWVVQTFGGPESAIRLARELNYEYITPVRGFEDTFVLHKRDHPTRSKRHAVHLTKRLVESDGVLWAEQQRSKRRTKRDYAPASPPLDKMSSADVDIMFDDPLWPKQWPLHDTRTMRELPKLDLHVIGAWKLGYTGRDVVVTILDDGIQHNHTDLIENYDPNASYDLNDNDTDPMPAFNDYNRHGTRCAGEVAMVANNKICGVGVAHHAKIGGIRMLDGRITDRLEAEALQFNIQHVDIYSASWGPNDDGRTVEGPGTLAERAIVNGIQNGRGGKGVIYVWASGNGGSFHDDCDCDGYADSIYTLSVSSAAQSGKFPWYGEKCASTMATTYSSGAYTDQKIITTDLDNECTMEHTGTSASAPLAAGIVALGIQANRQLTWRDVQHITVWTSEPAPLLHNPGWHTNARGLMANTRFGFGLMNAEAFVMAAKDWKPLPQQKTCTTTFPTFKIKKFAPGQPAVIKVKTDACQGQKNEVKYLEHVQLVTDLDYTRRGNLALFMTSPSGTRTKILSPRQRDNSKAGFRQWPFMSVHSWGEDPSGWWQLEAYDDQSESGQDFGSINNITLILYGSTDMPKHYANERKYNMDYNNVHDRSVANDPTATEADSDESPSKRQPYQNVEPVVNSDFRSVREAELNEALEKLISLRSLGDQDPDSSDTYEWSVSK